MYSFPKCLSFKEYHLRFLQYPLVDQTTNVVIKKLIIWHEHKLHEKNKNN